MKALILISTLSMILISGAVFAQTGKCREARDVVIDKTWGGIKYKYRILLRVFWQLKCR